MTSSAKRKVISLFTLRFALWTSRHRYLYTFVLDAAIGFDEADSAGFG